MRWGEVTVCGGYAECAVRGLSATANKRAAGTALLDGDSLICMWPTHAVELCLRRVDDSMFSLETAYDREPQSLTVVLQYNLQSQWVQTALPTTH